MTRPVVIFDSGVGGFSILKELYKKSISFPIFYLADQASFPYGGKSSSWLAKRLTVISSWIKSQNPVEVVVACNTASVNGLKLVRSLLDCPVVGVDPVVKPASQFTRSLILGTSSTVESERLADLKRVSGGKVISYAPTMLATHVENMEIEQVKKIILDIKSTVDREKIEAIGLSCTHYPLVKSLFEESIPYATMIDPSEAVASQALKVLPKVAVPSAPSKTFFYTTGDVLRFKYQIKHYLNLDVSPERVTI